MKSLEELRHIFKDDAFAMAAGIEIVGAGQGAATCAVELGPGHKNAAGAAMGGLVYTLADFAFAVAANGATAPGADPIVTLSADIHYLRPALGKRLTAVATPQKQGRRAVVYQVAVTDDEGRMVALMTATGM